MEKPLLSEKDRVFSCGSVSTLSKEEKPNMFISSEESCSYPDEAELELGLSLCSKANKAQQEKLACGSNSNWGPYGRILTAQDFAPMDSCAKTSSSSSSSSTAVNRKAADIASCGSKRTAEPSSPPPGRTGISQVIGWPPVRTYRINSLANHAKSSMTEAFTSTTDKSKDKNTRLNKANCGSIKKNELPQEKKHHKPTLFVKVNMDGIPIGRKIDLNAHSSYETLARMLDDMFRPDAPIGSQSSHAGLLNGSSEFVITYEDKDGDWMLVGDVPWEMFISSVKRLRIRKSADANGLAARS